MPARLMAVPTATPLFLMSSICERKVCFSVSVYFFGVEFFIENVCKLIYGRWQAEKFISKLIYFPFFLAFVCPRFILGFLSQGSMLFSAGDDRPRVGAG